MNKTSQRGTKSLRLNVPELYQNSAFVAYLNDTRNTLATWHSRPDVPGEFSDCFVTYDHGGGSNSDMPRWDHLCELVEQAFGTTQVYALLHLTNLEE